LAVTSNDPIVKMASYYRADPKDLGRKISWYDDWIEKLALEGIPIYRGNHIADMRTVEVGWWEEKNCGAAFLQLDGQWRVVDVRLTEVPPGGTTAPFKMAMDEKVYVLSGYGQCSIWADGHPKRSFEFQPHSLFFIPPNYNYELNNLRGDTPARLVHSTRLDIAASLINNPDFFFNNPLVDTSILYGDEDIFSEAKVIAAPEGMDQRALWTSNFIPDVHAWDHLEPYRRRGAGGMTVAFSAVHGGRQATRATMSVFPAQRYKMGHVHDAGAIIVIPRGEGYSVLWKPGSNERLVAHWKEGSLLVPPHMWYHQHFNMGSEPARYLKLNGHIPAFRESHQIDYSEEESWVRRNFDQELAKRGMESDMPEECYTTPNYQWPYGEDMGGD
jgi:hypothetical protein